MLFIETHAFHLLPALYHLLQVIFIYSFAGQLGRGIATAFSNMFWFKQRIIFHKNISTFSTNSLRTISPGIM